MSTVSAPTSEWTLQCLMRRAITVLTCRPSSVQLKTTLTMQELGGLSGCEGVRCEVRFWVRLALWLSELSGSAICGSTQRTFMLQRKPFSFIAF